MRLRTTRRLAKRANENSACPVYYDFRFSRWLNKAPGFSVFQDFFFVARDKPVYIKRCIKPPRNRHLGYHTWHTSKHVPDEKLAEWSEK